MLYRTEMYDVVIGKIRERQFKHRLHKSDQVTVLRETETI
jgi:hypothetical protein